MSVPEYWRKVLSGAWDRTYNPLGWNAKKVAVVLIAVGTIVAADVHLGLAAMITSAVGYLWIAVPVAFAAIILFVWGFLQTTASLCADLGNTSRTTISELEAALAQYQKPCARLRSVAACRSSDIAGGGIFVVRLVAGAINATERAGLVQCP